MNAVDICGSFIVVPLLELEKIGQIHQRKHKHSQNKSNHKCDQGFSPAYTRVAKIACDHRVDNSQSHLTCRLHDGIGECEMTVESKRGDECEHDEQWTEHSFVD